MDLADMLKDEPLNKELEDCLFTLDSGYKMIGHPLVHGNYSHYDNARYNKMLKVKKLSLKQAVAKGKIGSYIALHERPYRFEALNKALLEWWDPTTASYWEQVGWVWSDSENIYQYQLEWEELLFDLHPSPHLMMDEEERTFFNNLPDEITVYRGGVDDKGLSWTLDKSKAIWFASRNCQDYPVFTKRIIKNDDAVCYFKGRNEEEILLNRDSQKKGSKHESCRH